MIKGRAGVGGINDLMHWSEGDLSASFLPLMCDVKAALSISAMSVATLTYLEQELHIATVSYFS